MKKMLSVLAALGLVASGLLVLPARAQEAPVPEVPAEPNIVDPIGDAHYGAGTPADANSVSDLVAVWFTHDATNLNVHIQTEVPGPADTSAYYFDVTAVPVDGANCAAFELVMPGPNYISDPFGRFRDLCTEGAEQVPGEYVIQEAADGTGITTLTIPRADQAMLADGAVLGAPVARVRHATGPVPSQVPTIPVVGVGGGTFITGPSPDSTAVGTDYTITGAEVEEPVEEPKEEKPKKDKPKKKKKKKGPKPPVEEPPAGCAAYVPGEKGAELETAVVTDAATEEAPVELAVTTSPGVGAGRSGNLAPLVSHAFQNIQVDTDLEKAGLYVRVESLELWDYDLYLDRADGTEVAVSGGYMVVQDGNEADSHTEAGAETILGVATADCGGYTAEIVGATTAGGDVTVKLWLGEATYEPPA